MSLPYRAYKEFRSEGLRAVVDSARKKFIGYFDPVYQQIKPEYKSYSVEGASAEFDMSRRKLNQYDFVDDLHSERPLIERVLSVVDDDDVFYDIGANVGIYSCFIGTQLTSGSVVAFEPIPDAFESLRCNIEQNDIDAKLFNIALSNYNNTTRMSMKGQTGHQFSNDGTVEITTRSVDDLVKNNNISLPNVCKIDIEGAEYLALDGARNILADSTCRHLFCEIHTNKISDIGGTAEDVEKLLQSLGFEIQYLGDRRDNYFVEATRPR